MNTTITQWELQNADSDTKQLLAGADTLTVLGYSEPDFPDFEQRFQAHPTVREIMRDLLLAGRVRWYHNNAWPEFDQLFAWRGDPPEIPTLRNRHFFSQNLNHRMHRYNFVKGLVQRGLLAYSTVSYGNQPLPWDNCDCGRIHWDEPYVGKDPVIAQLNSTFAPDPRLNNPQWRWDRVCEVMAPPVNRWHEHALNIVTETTKTDTAVTEKTWQCVLYGQPFVSVTGENFHSEWAAQGWRISNNVLDTSWEHRPRSKDRLEGLLDMLEELSRWTAQDLYDGLSSSAEHNQRRLIQHMADIRLPKPVKFIPRTRHSVGAGVFYERANRVLEAVNRYARSREYT